MKQSKMNGMTVKSETGARFYNMLEAMKVGFTTVINGMVVTRWSPESYEVGTWGKSTMDIHKTADALMA